MKPIFIVLSLILALSACNSNDKIQLRAPKSETLDSKSTVDNDTSKLDTAFGQKASTH